MKARAKKGAGNGRPYSSPSLYDLPLWSGAEGSTTPSPERLLWVAVMRQAIEDLLNSSSVLSRYARAWFLAERRTTGGFVWLCDLLDLDPDRVRRQVLSLAWREEHE